MGYLQTIVEVVEASFWLVERTSWRLTEKILNRI
jgi:hypothetical protein